jgi:hypothetical protein
MDEWRTYGLSDFLLFSSRTYYRLFEINNAALWPAHIVAIAAGISILILMARPGPWQRPAMGCLLALSWLSVAWFYFHRRYQTINWAADYAAIAFAVEAVLFILWATSRESFAAHMSRRGRMAMALVIYALVLQPLIGPILGRSWVGVEIFAIAPNPTVTASVAIIAYVRSRLRWLLMIVPLTWCVVTALTEWAMGARDGTIMPIVAIISIALALSRDSPLSSRPTHRGSRRLSP